MIDDSNVERLRSATTTDKEKASLEMTPLGSIVRVAPVSDAGRRWLNYHYRDQATWDGPALIVERRMLPGFVEFAIDDGQLFLVSA